MVVHWTYLAGFTGDEANSFPARLGVNNAAEMTGVVAVADEDSRKIDGRLLNFALDFSLADVTAPNGTETNGTETTSTVADENPLPKPKASATRKGKKFKLAKHNRTLLTAD